MGLEFAVLGSGSSGNCSVLRTTHGLFLIDSGLSLRQTQRRLALLNCGLEEIAGIFVTHLDRDHFNPSWAGQLRRRPVPVFLADHHGSQRVVRTLPTHCVHLLEPGRSRVVDHFTVHRIDCAHDQTGCTAFIFEVKCCRLGWATDLGHVPAHLVELFSDLDAIAFESNYDAGMQLDSDRPEFLKERIMGGRGHLSNTQSIEALRTIAERSRLQHIALLHLSQHCNDPRIIRTLWEREAPHLASRLTLTDQREPTELLRVTAAAPAGSASG